MSGQSNILTIKINNWNKYQIRKDVHIMHWLRLESRIIDNPKFFNLLPTDKWVFIGLLCLVAQQCTARRELVETVEGDLKWFCMRLSMRQNDLENALEKLSLLRVVTISRDGHVTPTLRRRDEDVLYITEHNNTEQKDIAELPFSPPSCHDLQRVWNENCGELPKVTSLGASRVKAIKARLKENPDPNYWVSVVQAIANSPFCCGENDRGWRASFDFLLKPDTHIKALEGVYGGKKQEAWVPPEER